MSLWNILLAGSLLIVASGNARTFNDSGKTRYATNPPVKWIVENSSMLRVQGKSNVNQFSCDIFGYYDSDTIYCISEGSCKKPVRLNGCIEMDISKFDCHNAVMTKDLRKTLKAAEYPRLRILFLTLDELPSFQSTSQCMKGWVEVELAGVKKTFQINYDFVKNGSSSFILNGSRAFCFSDFKLVPPSKLGGLIKVNNDFNVNFQLKMSAIK